MIDDVPEAVITRILNHIKGRVFANECQLSAFVQSISEIGIVSIEVQEILYEKSMIEGGSVIVDTDQLVHFQRLDIHRKDFSVRDQKELIRLGMVPQARWLV